MLWEHVRAALLHRGAEPAVLSPPETLSAAQLLQMVEAAADLMQKVRHQLDQPVQGAVPSICAIFLTNSVAYITAVLAALRLGLAFMPLDPGWPPQRLQAVCEEARPVLIVWADKGAADGHGKPAVTGAPLLRLPALPDLLQQATTLQQQAEHVGGLLAPQEELPPLPPPGGSSGGGDDARALVAAGCCYVLYTSGSTGHPLGVCGTEAGVLNRCRWLQDVLPFQPGDRVAFKTAPCFVDSVWEVFGPLLAGVPLLVVPQAMVRRPDELLRLLASQRATHVAAVPTLWRALAGAMQRQPSVAAQLRLRLAVSSGEPLAAGLLGQLQRLLPSGCAVWNLYGSTEVAADCTAFDCTRWGLAGPDGRREPRTRQPQQQAAGGVQLREPHSQPGQPDWVPVGRPISGAVVTVLGPEPEGDPEGAAGAPGPAAAAERVSRRRALPAGELGEVAVGGTVLAAGYLGTHPATLAAQRSRFVRLAASELAQPAAQRSGAAGTEAAGEGGALQREPGGRAGERQLVRAFITGDLGWLDGSGCVHLAGRRDLQAKISGVRVDLAEVASALEGHPAVAAAAARVWHLPAGPVLEAYVELAGRQSTSGEELRGWCEQQLPPAVVPQRVQVLAALPRSAGGKVQRSELPPSAEVAAAVAAGAPATAMGGTAEAAAASAEAQAAAQEAGAPLQPGHPAKRPRLASTPPAPEAKQPAAAATPPLQPPQQQRPVSEVEVSAAFALALGHSDFEATTNLFSIGGTSLTAAEIAGEVAHGRVEAVLQHPTVRSLAAHLNALAHGQAPKGGLAAAARGVAGAEAEYVKAAHADRQHAQRAAAEPAAALAGARPLDLHGDASTAEQVEHASCGLRLAWRAKLLQCVDAAPLVVGGQQQPEHGAAGRIFSCSHGGDVCCFDGASGHRLWQTVLPDRTDAGLALCHGPSPARIIDLQPKQSGSQQLDSQQEGIGQQGVQQQCGGQMQAFVAAATNGGELFFLVAASGEIAGSVPAGGGLRAPPACDPWAGLVWQPTHGRQLLLVAAPGREVGRLPLPAAVSAAVSFSAARRLAFVCCLDGSLLAIQVTGQHQAQSQQGRQEDQQEQPALQQPAASQLQLAWQWRATAPLFAPAAVAGGSVLAAAVDGSVTALSCSDGGALWRTAVHGAVFSAPVLLEPPAAAARSAVLLVGTQGGQLAALEASTGRQLAMAQVGDRVTGLRPLHSHSVGAAWARGLNGPRKEQDQQQQGMQRDQRQLLVATLACGVVVLVDVAALLQASSGSAGVCSSGSSSNPCSDERGSWLVDSVRLPGDVFAVPAAGPAFCGGACVAVGCRDDHLYCLALSG